MWRRRSGLLLALALLAAALFVARAVSVAAVAGGHPGSPDSTANLLTARSWIEGQGGAIAAIEHHHRRQTLPAVSSLRPPGLPLLFTPWLAQLPDSGPSVVVVFNACTVMLAAGLLAWLLLALSGSRGCACLGFTLALLASHYELVSLWNNDVLVAVSLAGVVAVVRAHEGRGGSARSAAGLGVLWFLGAACKPTMLVWALATGWAYWRGLRANAGGALARRRLLLAAATFAVCFAPLVAWDFATFGRPSPQPVGVVLWAKYGLEAYHPYAVHFDAEPTLAAGLAQVQEIHGGAWPLRHELHSLARSLQTMVAELGFLVVPLLAGLFVAGARENRRSWLLALAGVVSVVDVAAAKLELRYAFPLLFACIGLACLGARQAWYQLRVDAELHRWVSVVLAVSLGVAGVWSARAFRQDWQADLEAARRGPPPEVSLVEGLPEDAVLFYDEDVSRLVWWTRRAGVQAPRHTEAAGVLAVCRHYGVGYYLSHKPDALLARYLGGTGFEAIGAREGWRLLRLDCGDLASREPAEVQRGG